MAEPRLVPQKSSDLPPAKIAFIIDNEVVDILHTDERLAAIFLSQPEIMDVTDLVAKGALVSQVAVGSTYNPNTKEFTLNPDLKEQLEDEIKAAEAQAALDLESAQELLDSKNRGE